MSNSLILFLWFLGGALSSLSWYGILSAFRSGHRDTFEPYSCYWIFFKSFLCGCISWMFCIALIQHMQQSEHLWLSTLVIVCLVFLNSFPVVGNGLTLFDRVVAYCGYLVSRIHPYEPVDAPLPEGQKPVIPHNHKLSAATSLGAIELIAGTGTLRTIKWDGVTRQIALIRNERRSWFDGFDFRSSKVEPTGYIWKMHRCIAKCHYYEAIKNCDNIKAAAEFVEGMKERVMPGVASSDGLVIAWSTETERDVLTVLVYQVLVNGQKPSNLPGADDSQISLTPCK